MYIMLEAFEACRYIHWSEKYDIFLKIVKMIFLIANKKILRKTDQNKRCFT